MGDLIKLSEIEPIISTIYGKRELITDYTVYQCLETLTYYSDSATFQGKISEAYRELK